MNDDRRPDPDALLRRVQAEEARRARATLKIFLGYAPGVGKTFTMLESAQRLVATGVDLAAACVETHGRAETEALLQGLDVLPRQTLVYRGAHLLELDLDRALARHPRVLLVDELAHTNAPGSRHPKRWQDVIELLDAGIDVHTTLNIQHVESLNDVVAQITGVRVRETVPDSILARADEIEIIDLPPEELLLRLQAGKVYVPDAARAAVQNFFRRGNLLALRELALRRTAERVDLDVSAWRREHDIQVPWPAGERLLVCVGPSPSSAHLLRGACRMAAGLRAPWVAAWVDAGDAYPMTPLDRERLKAHLRLAESLGAQVVRLSGARVADEVLRYAREQNVTRLVVGKPTHSRWRDLLKGSLVTDLVRGSGAIEVHFIPGDASPSSSVARAQQARRALDTRGMLFGAAWVAAATGLGALTRSVGAQADVVALYLLAIMLVAYRHDRASSLVAAALSVGSYDFFFVPPFYTFSVENLRHVLTFATMFGVGLVISSLTGRLRRQEQAARHREKRTASLYALTREVAAATDAGQAAAVIARHAAPVFGGRAAVLLPDASGDLQEAGAFPMGGGLDDAEVAVARWAFEHGRPAGPGTDTLAGAPVQCIPLQGGPRVEGVLTVRAASGDLLGPEHRGFLEAFVRQSTLPLERLRLAEEARAAAVRAHTEEIRSSLLSAVSHDLRTPLATITGAGTTLRDDAGRLDPAQRAELLATICDEAERLERLVGNILDVVRLETGDVRLRRDWLPLEEVIGSALALLTGRPGAAEIRVDLPEGLPLVALDPVLFEHAFVNLLENALAYAGAASGISVAAREVGGALAIEVADGGPGVPPGDEARVFEKFYRGPGARAGGAGLGLAICRGVVEAHGGTITASNRPGGGACFLIRLPLDEARPRAHPPREGEPTVDEELRP
jgi:two-component system sensor histidine kinase KdpD